MSHAIPVFVAIFLCLLAAGLVGRHLFAAPRPRTRLSRLDWQVWRAAAWLDLHVYAWRWTALRWHLMLRARFAAEVARPDGLPLIPASGAARFRPGSAGLPNLDHVLPGLRARLDDSKLRARVAADLAHPEGTAPTPAPGAVPLAEPERFARAMHSALHALDDAARTRDDLTVIHAGGMLLPDRPRTVYEPGPFRVPPYYKAWEQGRWIP